MKILIFGATGLAGGGVLQACFDALGVDDVRVITRRPVGLTHQKLKTFLHDDFLNYASVRPAFAGIDACFFCLGISVMQVSGEMEYRRITHDFAMAAARELKNISPKAVFHYVSGRGTSLDSRMMWARVKAQTEQDLIALTLSAGWRPAFIDGKPSAGTPHLFKVLRPVLKLLKPIRSLYVDGHDLGRAMIQATVENIQGRVIENTEIRRMAARYGLHT